MSFAWPVPASVMVRGVSKPRAISSYFGPRSNPVTGEGQNHGAIDIPVDAGTTVRAIGGGTVGLTEPNHPTAGGYVTIDHGNGYWSRYLHLSQIGVTKGQTVSMGTPIGLSGGLPGAYGAGRSTGPHLHLEIWKGEPFNGGTPIDPLPFLTQEAGGILRSYWWVFALGTAAIGGAVYWRYYRGR